jgi:hypothetical protein
LNENFVISTGFAMGLWLTQGDEKRLGPATDFYGTAALSFVIPSEAEGSAVRGPLLETLNLSSNKIVISTGAYPDFLPRVAGHGHVCGFH